ncbi:hypothetical protein [Massilia sp. GCM10023247]|uniref:hypothetical protein n=1 Tax=Massilia sp. GCM10023247 TaxID=3252643 RepID=UPI003608A81E
MTVSAVAAVAVPGTRADASGEARHDLRQRAIVDAGLAVLVSSNMMSAFEYLRTRDIATDVIERVLLEPDQRRSTG